MNIHLRLILLPRDVDEAFAPKPIANAVKIADLPLPLFPTSKFLMRIKLNHQVSMTHKIL